MEDEEENVNSYAMVLRKNYIIELKTEALDRTIWRAHFEIGYGPHARQTTE
jgi:hypothetical protein